MHRFFTTDIQSNTAHIHGDDVKHIAKVLRLKPGDHVQICDGDGYECIAVIRSIAADDVACETVEWQRSISEPNVSVTVFQCIPKAGKMETIIQKCVELGADAFVPVQAERCVVQLKPPYDARIERWQRVAEEAAKQSRRGRISMVKTPCTTDKLCFEGFDLVLTAYENEREQTLKSTLRMHPNAKRIAIVIGPEGGFSEQEIALLQRNGAEIVTLGTRILRTETAGMTMLAQIMYEVES